VTTVSPQKQRELALHVLQRLREAGYQALWAGGCVRDQLLDRVPNDYDVATNATPPEIRTVFGRRRTLEIGAAFGVVAVLGPKQAGMVEVTTFRRDATYSDGRHPDAVVFSTAEEDAQRRDFTINGLFYDPLEDRVIDYVAGLPDLERRVVRAIGDPRARFGEDKLRMVRAVRIAAGFDFAIDAETAAAIEEMAETIQVVSPERVAQEMRKMLVNARRDMALELLHRTRLLGALLPELLQIAPPRDEQGVPSDAPALWLHTRRVLSALSDPEFPLALAALVHGLDETPVAASLDNSRPSAALATAIAICDRWKLSNKERDRVTWLVQHRGRLAGAAQQRWSELQPLLVTPEASDLIALHEAEGRAGDSTETSRAAAEAAFCRARLALPAAQLDPPPLLGGHDLIAHGVPKGNIYKVLLDRVRAAQLDGEVRTRDEALTLVDRLQRDADPA